MVFLFRVAIVVDEGFGPHDATHLKALVQVEEVQGRNVLFCSTLEYTLDCTLESREGDIGVTVLSKDGRHHVDFVVRFTGAATIDDEVVKVRARIDWIGSAVLLDLTGQFAVFEVDRRLQDLALQLSLVRRFAKADQLLIVEEEDLVF